MFSSQIGKKEFTVEIFFFSREYSAQIFKEIKMENNVMNNDFL